MMDLFCTVLSLAASVLIFLIITVLYMTAKIYTGKSIHNPEYPPVYGTIFGLIFHINRLYDHQLELARKQETFRFLAFKHSVINTTNPLNIEHVLKTKFENYTKGEYNIDIFTDLFGQGIFAADGGKWKQQRKLASVEFSTRVLRDYSCSVFRENTAKLVRKVMEFSDSGRDFDANDLLLRCALDSISKVGFGVELKCLEGSNKEGAEFMRAFDESNALVYRRFVNPFWKLKRLLNIGSEAELKKNVKILDAFVFKVISSKKKLLANQRDSCVKEDILSRFLVESEKDPVTMNDKYLKDIILNFMIAGKDTTANTLSWFLYMLCKNPLVQEKVAQEVKDVTGGHENGVDIDEFVESITEESMNKMQYLHAALTETLRLYPVVPVDGRCAESDDVLPDGYKVKKGDDVNYLAYAMGRLPRLWGEDAEHYRPERWLKDGIFQPESPFKFVPFHAGPRICLGKDFAYRQMKIVSMALLRFYRFRLADETRTVTYRTMLTLHLDGGLNLRVVPRASA